MSRSRAIRRHHRQRLWRKRKRYHNGWGLKGGGTSYVIRDTPKLCSCILCSRSKWRTFGEVTHQERLADLNAHEQRKEQELCDSHTI